MNDINVYVTVALLFRSPAVLIFFLLLWAGNVALFKAFDVDFATALGMSIEETLQERDILRATAVLFTIYVSALYITVTYATYPFVGAAVPVAMYMSLLYIVVTSQQAFYWKTRALLLGIFRRVFSPVISPGVRVSFAEVFVTDALTSLSNVLGDMEVVACCMAWYVFQWTGGDAAEATCSSSYLLPAVVSMPFLLRCKQCFIEYRATRHPRDMLNFLKYATAFPAIWTGFLLRTSPEPRPELRAMWVLCTAINAVYSFVWDVRMDWGICDASSPNFPLRTHTMYPAAWYYVAVALDLGLRFSWAIRLSTLITLSSNELALLFQMLEVVRRGMWNIFRVEYECVRLHSLSTLLKHPPHLLTNEVPLIKHHGPAPVEGVEKQS